MNIKQFYVNISIKKYNSFENIIKLINLIDENVIGIENVFETSYIAEWSRAFDTQYDYKCTINLHDEQIILYDEQIILHDEKINNYIKVKFKLIENYIKFNNDKFGTEWSISFIINK
jgi:hypothetical protein